MKKIIVLLIYGSLLVITNKTSNYPIITEEASPNRNNNFIESMDYRIMINNSQEERIEYSTKVMESVKHYLDVSNRDKFLINLKFINNSHDTYYLKKIIVLTNKSTIKIYNYNKKLDYTPVEIVLSKKMLEDINDSTLKIIIEK